MVLVFIEAGAIKLITRTRLNFPDGRDVQRFFVAWCVFSFGNAATIELENDRERNERGPIIERPNPLKDDPIITLKHFHQLY
jgi:hypothetical protein